MRSWRSYLTLLTCPLLCSWLPARAPAADPAVMILTLKLEVGGGVFGEVLDHSERVIVLEYRGVPCAFGFDELTVASAYRAKKRLLLDASHSPGELSAEDHFLLGRYALSRDHAALANREFKQAVRLDAGYRDRVAELRAAYRKRDRSSRRSARANPLDRPAKAEAAVLPGLGNVVEQLDSPTRQRVIDAYRRFGQSVRDTINRDLVLLETEHFLIWTDWDAARRGRLPDWCEGMYAALAARFSLPLDGHVFLGKCPVFCFRSKARFRRFAETYDNWPKCNALGYTRTEPSGHTHLVVYRRRGSAYETERFAGTLVHEGVHAFLLNYGRIFHISGWVGEGLANYIAQEVLGERCIYGQQAAMVARQFVKRGLSIGELLNKTVMPAPHEYPVAHSLVGFLIERDAAAFARFIGTIKAGRGVEEALRRSYDGLDFAGLEADWRKAMGVEE